MSKISERLGSVVMPICVECQDEHYILHGCCSGRECGCMGKPTMMTNCTKCNPRGDKPAGDYVNEWSEFIEYKFTGEMK